MTDLTVCFTGHRHLPPDKRNAVAASLIRAIAEAYSNGYRRFMCGGALGFDTIAALQVLELKKVHPDIRLILVIPCLNQAKRWSDHDRRIYETISTQSDERIVLSPEYYQGCMQTRNRYMVDHSSLCICYLYSLRGGTAYTVRYAVFHDVPVINLAMDCPQSEPILREDQCCCMFTSRSAKENAGIAHSFHMKTKSLRQKDT
jgi:uncharacterized phage-like protein YoqJ